MCMFFFPRSFFRFMKIQPFDRLNLKSLLVKRKHLVRFAFFCVVLRYGRYGFPSFKTSIPPNDLRFYSSIRQFLEV